MLRNTLGSGKIGVGNAGTTHTKVRAMKPETIEINGVTIRTETMRQALSDLRSALRLYRGELNVMIPLDDGRSINARSTGTIRGYKTRYVGELLSQEGRTITMYKLNYE